MTLPYFTAGIVPDLSNPQFHPVFPLPVIVAVAGIAAFFTVYRAFAGRPLRPSWLQVPVVALRLVVIGLLALILANPSEQVSIDEPESRSLILLDRSASMKLPTGEKSTRWSDAVAWAEQARAELSKAGQPVPAIAVFGGDLEDVRDPASLKRMVPESKETQFAAALKRLMERGKDQAPQQIIMVSDGRVHDRGELPSALAAARDGGAKVSTKLVGTDVPPRNAWIAAVQAPRSVRAKGRVAVQVDLAAAGIAPEEKMSLILREEGGKEIERKDYHPPAADAAGSPTELSLAFDIGLRTTSYTLELTPAPDEVSTEDNRFAFTVEVSSSKLRVLFVEGTHVKRTVGLSGYWWNDMELMTRSWDATGEIEYECLTPVSEYNDSPNLIGVTFENGEMRQNPAKSFPSTREELYRFDVMLISDVPVGNFSEEQMQWVVDWVNERGGGFLMGGGYTTFDVGNYDQTPWERIIPVDMLAYGAGFMEKPFPIKIPESVRTHPLWRVSEIPEENETILNAHPIFTGMNRVKRAKPGAIVLAVRADVEGEEPVIAAQSYGRGRSIAWLPDPNGGWAREYVKWGPPGGPPHGKHTELGHGPSFKFKEEAARAFTGPPPSHPSPWYGQYWVNLVKWLGEHSIRWHRDKLAGRSRSAAAKPGTMLPVAAEVLAATKLDELLALDVGARLDIPGTARVRLEYDRDAREFIGELPVPVDADGEQVTVYFDVSVGGTGYTDTVPVGLRRSHLEFTETAPDHAFMEELAAAAAGKVLETPANAVSWLAEVSEAHAKQAATSWHQPVWPRWPLLATIIVLLCLEWAIRRRATMPLAAMVAFFLAMPGRSEAQTEAADIPALIEQLAAPKVRLRDEAEDRLAKMPAAGEALRKAAAEHPNPEARLRATNALLVLRQATWVLESTVPCHPRSSQIPSLVAMRDGSHFFTRGEDDALKWTTATLEMNRVLADPLGSTGDWKREWPVATLALSKDATRLVTGSDFGSFKIHDAVTGADVLTLQSINPENPEITPTCAAAYSPDGKALATATISNKVFLWDGTSTTPNYETTIPAASLRLIFSNDSRYLLFGIDFDGEPDLLWIQRTADHEWVQQLKLPNRVQSFDFSPDGTRLVAGLRDGTYYTWRFKEGKLTDEKIIFRTPGISEQAKFSQDGLSIFVCGTHPPEALHQINSETGEILWKAPTIPQGCHDLDLLGPDRIVTSCGDKKIRIWKRSQ